MRKFYWLIPALLFLAIGASPARADEFSWTFTGNHNTGSGTLTTGAFSGGQATITAITGTFGGYAIDVLDAPGTFPSGTAPNDNLLFYPGTPYLDFSGLSFLLTSGGGQVNLFYFSSVNSYQTANTFLIADSYGSFSVTPIATPEPGTLVLLLFGLVALVLVRKRLARGLQPVT